jgi:protein-histidine pros-kinase
MPRTLGARRSTDERRLRDLLQIAPDAMLVVDQLGVIVLVNPQTEKLFGYQQEEMLGRPVEILIPQRFRRRHQGHRTNLFDEPRLRPMGAKLELFGLRKDGTEFPVEISLSPVETREGILNVPFESSYPSGLLNQGFNWQDSGFLQRSRVISLSASGWKRRYTPARNG